MGVQKKGVTQKEIAFPLFCFCLVLFLLFGFAFAMTRCALPAAIASVLVVVQIWEHSRSSLPLRGFPLRGFPHSPSPYP